MKIDFYVPGVLLRILISFNSVNKYHTCKYINLIILFDSYKPSGME